MSIGYNTNFRTSNGGFTCTDLNSIFVNKDYFSEGGLWIWGRATGDNTTISRSSPVQTISGGMSWIQISVSSSHSAAIKTDGTLWIWGGNFNGNLGDNTGIDRSSPVQTISGGTNWRQVAAGTTFGAAIKTDGTLWTWGRSLGGALGDNTTIYRSSPVQVVGNATNWKSISLPIQAPLSAGGIKTDGTLWMWGCNCRGILGDNTVIDRSSPVQTISGGTNWRHLSVGSPTTGAIKTDGTLWMWGGSNAFGSTGDNTGIDRSSPVQTISGGTNWRQVAAGQATTAIKTDGTLWAWGDNFFGSAGDNTTIYRSSPVQVVGNATNWRSVSLGAGFGYTSLAIKTDGTLWTWGGGGGILGNNSTIRQSSPVQTIAGGTGWRSVNYGGAIREGCW